MVVVSTAEGRGHSVPGQLHTQQRSSLSFTVPSDFIVPKKDEMIKVKASLNVFIFYKLSHMHTCKTRVRKQEQLQWPKTYIFSWDVAQGYI